MKEKLIQKLLALVYKLDNSGNSDMNKNGEKKFIDSVVQEFKSPVVFDVGANVGEYSKYIWNKSFGRAECHLFEPQESCYDVIPTHIGKINNFGLSDKEETLTLYKNCEGSGLASVYKRNLDFYGMKMSQSEQIQLRRADSYIEENQIKHINLLKIDVEGHELAVLRGFGKYLRPDFIDYIQFEYGGANLDSRTNLLDFYNLLNPLGFKIAKIMPNGLKVRDYNPRHDNFVYANYVAMGGDN